MSRESKSRCMLILSMCIFSTVGILRKYIPLPSSFVALARAAIGASFLLFLIRIRKQALDRAALWKNLPALLLSGCALGFNWILLFESYRHTSVATATLCYYLAPVLVILASPLVLKEKLTVRKIVCTIVALAGMVLVCGITENGLNTDRTGILFGLGAAVLYASVMVLNKIISQIDAYDRTFFQLAVSSVVLLPYVLITEDIGAMSFSPLSLGLLTVAGILHTGIAYWLYFGSIGTLKAQTAALLSYIDPILAIVLSMLVLREPMSIGAVIGAVMILGAAIISEG